MRECMGSREAAKYVVGILWERTFRIALLKLGSLEAIAKALVAPCLTATFSSMNISVRTLQDQHKPWQQRDSSIGGLATLTNLLLVGAHLTMPALRQLTTS